MRTHSLAVQARFTVSSAVLAIGVAACTDQPPPTSPSAAPVAAGPVFAISDGAHSGGNPDFFFLPPLQASPNRNANFDRGQFNPNLSPVVKICDGRDLTSAGECVHALMKNGEPVIFTAGRGWDGLPDWVDPEQYHVLWQTKDYNLVSGSPYRIVVKVGSILLGFLDVVPANGLLGALRITAAGADIGWLHDWIVPIRFRIEEGALPGGRIVFRSDDPQAGLYGVRPDGAGRFQVFAPSWAAYSDVSPDGRWIVYAGNSGPGGELEGKVGVQPVDGSEWRILFLQNNRDVAGVSWSSVGDRIVFAAQPCGGCRYQLHVADTAGASVTQITSGPEGAAFPAWSPDGTRIAFSTFPGPGIDRDVWIVNADGSNPVRVTGPGASETHPAWISNTRLVIARGAPADLYLVNVDGTSLKQLTSSPESDYWPRPSPDRRWVVFVTGSNSLSIVSVDGGVPLGVPTATSGGHFPSWGREPGPTSPVGSQHGLSLGADTTITVGDTARFQVVNSSGRPVPSPAIRWASNDPQVASTIADGRIVALQLGRAVITAQLGSWTVARNVTVSLPGGRIVFRSDAPQTGLYGVRPDGTRRFQIAAPSWVSYSDVSPDGRSIVYAGNPGEGTELVEGKVGVQPADGSEARILFDQPGTTGGVSWSPVGDRIVFAASVNGRPFQLYVADTAGASVRQITTGSGAAAFPAWSPDGTRVAFSTFFGSQGGTPRTVWIVNADGSNPVRVTGEEASSTHPAWISNTRLVISRGIVGQPYALYLVNIDGTNLVQLTSDPGRAMWPHPSPDRRWVVFWTGSDSLSVVSVDGRGPFHVSTVTSGQLFPSWGREPGPTSAP